MADSVASVVVQAEGAGTKKRVYERVLAALRNFGPLVALGVLSAIFSLIDGHFATLENVQIILETSAIPLVLATGATFVIVMGSIDLSVEGVMGISCVVTSILVANTENGNNYGILG